MSGVPLRPLFFGIWHLPAGRIGCSDVGLGIVRGKMTRSIQPRAFLSVPYQDGSMKALSEATQVSEMRADVLTATERERARELLWACARVWLALSRTYR